MDYDTFLNLETAEIAKIVQAQGPKTCGLIFNGTRRWFTLEHDLEDQNSTSVYLEKTSNRLIEICKILFDHGIKNLLLPMINPHIMSRGEAYLAVAAKAFEELTSHSRYLEFYESYKVRVRFYGQYRDCLAKTPYSFLSDQFEKLTNNTLKHEEHKLFWGICADDSISEIVKLAVQYAKDHGHAPDKQTLTELYYGEYVSRLELYLHSGKPYVADMPLLSLGREQLYFSISPMPYFSAQQLRSVLYDFLYSRRTKIAEYNEISNEDLASLREYYRDNAGNTLGVGTYNPNWRIWHPTPQVTLSNE